MTSPSRLSYRHLAVNHQFEQPAPGMPLPTAAVPARFRDPLVVGKIKTQTIRRTILIQELLVQLPNRRILHNRNANRGSPQLVTSTSGLHNMLETPLGKLYATEIFGDAHD
jgi:hypothetical protein